MDRIYDALRLSRLLVSFRTHIKSIHLHFISQANNETPQPATTRQPQIFSYLARKQTTSDWTFSCYRQTNTSFRTSPVYAVTHTHMQVFIRL